MKLRWRSTLGLAIAALSASASASAGGTIEIPRTTPGTLTGTTVAAVLVAASWRYSNPDKIHSTWESMTLDFDASGNVDIAWWGPMQHREKRTWHVIAGNAPAIDIAGVTYKLAPCVFPPQTTCLVGPRP